MSRFNLIANWWSRSTTKSVLPSLIIWKIIIISEDNTDLVAEWYKLRLSDRAEFNSGVLWILEKWFSKLRKFFRIQMVRTSIKTVGLGSDCPDLTVLFLLKLPSEAAPCDQDSKTGIVMQIHVHRMLCGNTIRYGH